MNPRIGDHRGRAAAAQERRASRRVYSELVKMTPQPVLARYLAACIRRVRAVTHCGNRIGTRSWIVVARRPSRCGGYIQSEKWKTSKCPRTRSMLGRPAWLQATRHASATGSVTMTGSATSPFRAWRIRYAPRRPTGANATISWPPRRRRRRGRRPCRGCSSRCPFAGARAGSRRSRYAWPRPDTTESVQGQNSIHVVAGRRRRSRACAIVIGFDLLSAAGVVVP